MVIPIDSLHGTPLLRVEHLWVRKGGLRGKKWIVKDVSFEIKPGEFVAIIGPNGAGKTKLLEAIVGDRPCAGSVTFHGHDLYSQPEYWLQQLGWVPSYNILHDSLMAEQALLQVARLRLPGVPEEARVKRIYRLLDQLDFPASRRGAFIRELSSGERKRLDLCAELITNPPLLILDEPTTNLDPDAERFLMELLRNRAWGKHQAVVVVTHTLQSLYLCDHLLFMAHGRVRAEGPPVEILEQLESKLNEEAQKSRVFTNNLPTKNISGFQLEPVPKGNVTDDASRWAAVYRKAKIFENEPHLHAPPKQKRTSPEKPSAPISRPRRNHWITELRILLRRNWLLFINNPYALGIFLLLGPFSGLLSRIVLRENSFIQDQGTGSYSTVFDTTDARQAVFIIALVVTLLGLIGSFLDVTRERPIYRYERIKGLSPWAYILSKWIMLAFLVGIIAPSFLLIVLTYHGQVLPNPHYALITLFLACIAAVTLGLAISAIAHNERTATGLLGVCVVFFLFFSGGVEFNERFRGLLERLSVLAASHWAAEGLSSGIQLYCWASTPRFQDFTSLGHLASVWLYLLVYILVALLAALIALRLQDAWFVPRERLWKAINNKYIWSVLPLVSVAFSWAFFFRERSLDFYNLRADVDNIRITDFRNRDIFQSINGFLGQSRCPVPEVLPAPAIRIVAMPPTPEAAVTQPPLVTATPADTLVSPTMMPSNEIESDLLPLPTGITIRTVQILFGPHHSDLPIETLPAGAEFTLLGKDLEGEWFRIRERSTGRSLTGWIPVDSTNLLPSQAGAVAKPPACAAPRAYLEADGQTPISEWVSDVEGHVVLVVDLFRNEAGIEVSQGEISLLLDSQVVDRFPIHPTRHSFLFRGLAIDLQVYREQHLQIVLLDIPYFGKPLYLRTSVFYVPAGCSFQDVG